MTYRIPRRGWLVAAAAFSVVMLWAFAATQARADGEDDPSFGTGGAAYVQLPFFFQRLGQPLVDVAPAPDGHIYAATSVDTGEVGNLRGTESGSQIGVVRLTPAGQQDTTYGGGDGVALFGAVGAADVLDVEALADGTVIVLHRDDFGPAGRGRASGPLVRTVLAPGGEVDGQDRFFRPIDCDVLQPFVAAAQVGADPDVTYGLYEDCEETSRPLLVRFGATEEHAELPSPASDAIDLALGPDGDVYALAAFEVITRGGGTRGSVFRYGADLTPAAGYGDGKDFGAVLSGHPIDFDVDGTGRAVAWIADSRLDEDRGNAEAWHIQRLLANGDPDLDWGQEGLVTLEGEPFGPPGCSGGEPEFRCFPQHSYVFAQPDGKVVLVGKPQGQDEVFARGNFSTMDLGPRTIARLTATGGLDPLWDGDGVKTFAVGDEGEVAGTIAGTLPVLQGDGKLLLPFLAYNNEGLDNRVPAPASGGVYLGVARFGLTPAEQQQPQQQQQQAAPPPPPVQTVVASQAPRQCRSRRQFRIRLRTGRRKAERSPIVSAVVRVNGKRVKVTRRARRTATVNLRNLPAGRFTVSIRLRLKDGGTVSETRRYRTCAKKVERELSPLRTRKPRSKRS